MRKRLWPVCAILLLPLPAFAACDAAGPPPEVRLVTKVAEPSYHNTRSRSELDRLAARPLAAENMKHSGLTRSRAEFRIEPRLRVTGRKRGPACVRLELVTATWEIAELTVDIVRDYRPGSCAYHEVRQHEDEHVRITRDSFQAYAPKLKARLAAEARAVEAVETDAPEAEAQRVTARLSAAARDVLDAFHAEMSRRNGEIDTLDSYRAVSARCRRW